MNSRYLFVYGSLMLNIGSPMSAFLAQHAQFIGVGKVRGHLYDIGSYPGLVLNQQTNDEVIGHVFALKNAPQTWQILDKYEDYREDDPENSLYRRVNVTVALLEESKVCQTYVYNRSVEDLQRIPTGNYADWWQGQARHRAFIEQGGNAADFV